MVLSLIHILRGTIVQLSSFILVPLFIAGSVFATSTDAFAWRKTLFLNCKTNDSVTLTEDGSLRQSAVGRGIEFTVDLETGMVRLKNSFGQVWSILREGDRENDTVLVGQLTDPSRTPDLVLRIRDWESLSTITFMQTRLTTISSGVCEPIR